MAGNSVDKSNISPDHMVAAEQFGLAAITNHDRANTAAPLQQLAREKDLPEMTGLLCFGLGLPPSGFDNLARFQYQRLIKLSLEFGQK